jgi:DNA-binding CsgD family transcriptional regulator
MPHMSASVELHKNMDRVQQLANTTSNILDSAPRGIVALSNRQQIWYSNASAESTLADNDGVTHNKHMLKFADSTIQAEFLNQLDLLETMPAEQLADVRWDILVPRSSGRPAYQMMMRAMTLLDWNTESTRGGRIALIYLNDSSQNMQPTFEQIKNFHGLTSAEAKIAAILYNGVSPADAATELGISIHTVRSHLRNIFSKVGVRNQPELISKLVSTLKHREA